MNKIKYEKIWDGKQEGRYRVYSWTATRGKIRGYGSNKMTAKLDLEYIEGMYKERHTTK